MEYDVFIYEVLGGDVLNTEGAEVNCACPNCGREDKFYVNREKGVGWCMRCEYTGGALKLVTDVEGLSFPDATIRVEILTRGSKRITPKHIHSENEEEDEDAGFMQEMLERMSPESNVDPIVYEFVEMPSNTRPIKGTPGAWYLQERGFSMRALNKYRLLWCGKNRIELKRLNHHILMPDYDPATGDLRYWTSRYAGANPPGQKSYNVKGPKKHILYGHFAIPKSERSCILVEGPLDAIALQEHGISLLGKSISTEQCEMVVNAFSTVVVCLDSDAKSSTLTVAKKLCEAGIQRCMVSHTGDSYGDPAEALEDEGHKGTYELILDNAVEFTPEVEVQWRIHR